MPKITFIVNSFMFFPRHLPYCNVEKKKNAEDFISIILTELCKIYDFFTYKY